MKLQANRRRVLIVYRFQLFIYHQRQAHSHSALGWKSPVAFKRKVAKRALGAARNRDRSNPCIRRDDLVFPKQNLISPAALCQGALVESIPEIFDPRRERSRVQLSDPCAAVC